MEEQLLRNTQPYVWKSFQSGGMDHKPCGLDQNLFLSFFAKDQIPLGSSQRGKVGNYFISNIQYAQHSNNNNNTVNKLKKGT